MGAGGFANRRLSYSKVRGVTRLATPENETELVDLAMSVPAGELGAALAVWLNTNTTPQELDEYQRSRRSVKWRTDPDGIVTFTLRLQPLIAGILIALLTTIVMRSKPRPETGETWPTVAQQNADAIAEVLSNGAGRIVTEIVLHVRGDGCTLDDGTPITDSVIEQVAPARPTLRRLRPNRATRVRPPAATQPVRPYHHHRTTTPLLTLPPEEPNQMTATPPRNQLPWIISPRRCARTRIRMQR
jgi:hypothetical protein